MRSTRTTLMSWAWPERSPAEVDLAETLADMLADPERGQRLPARAANAHLNRPERERGSVLSTVVRHTSWLDDPRLCAALARSDFSLRDLKRRPMTVYLAIPPDRLRACLGFVRGFIGLTLDAVIAAPGKPVHRVAFFLDEFGQLGRMDRLVDSITLLRGYGGQLWLFVQDLSQLRAVYPRWQSFMANTTRQFFGTADYDTARYISDAIGQQTISFETTSRSYQEGHGFQLGTHSSGRGEHLQDRALLTPDEVIRLGSKRPVVMITGEPPYLLDRINYQADPTLPAASIPTRCIWEWPQNERGLAILRSHAPDYRRRHRAQGVLSRMLTWLNYFYKQTIPLVDVKWHGGDPRKALAFYVGRCILDAQRRIAPFEDALDEAFHVMLMPFLQVFLPAGATWKTTNGIEVSRPLGLLLRHSTANLLIERGGSKYLRCNVAVSPWRRSRCVR